LDAEGGEKGRRRCVVLIVRETRYWFEEREERIFPYQFICIA